MKLKAIILENFGLFRGHNRIDLNTRKKYGKVKPLVLIGGKNGSGKTTILESIRLCLYGKRAVADRISIADYQEYLRSKIHRDDDALIKSNSAAVGLVFTHSQLGEKHEYEVVRSWEQNGSKLIVNLEVLKNGEPIDEIDRENADEFLSDLIPQGVSQLYFFDGEKIQQLAESSDEDAALSDAIKSLLGLELIDRLQSDLKIYSGRMAAKSSSSETTKQIQEVLKEIVTLEEAYSCAQRKLEEAESECDRARIEIDRQEIRLAREGGAYADKRELIQENRKKHETNVNDLENLIRRHAEDLLPFTLVPELCDKVEKQIELEQIFNQQNILDCAIEDRIASCQTALCELIDNSLKKLSLSNVNSFKKQVERTLKKSFASEKSQRPINSVHNLSQPQAVKLLSAIDKCKKEIPKEIAGIRSTLEKETRLLQKAENDLKKVPNDDQLQPVIQEINRLNQQLGAKKLLVSQSKTELNSIAFKRDDLRRKHKKLEAEDSRASKKAEKQRLTDSVQKVLEKYREKLLLSKASELGNALQNRFSELWRKGDRAKRIEINQHTFEVTLFDRNERPVPKKELSAGEKQMYAISVLWALADVSGRPLPIVIDTPLGRLDADHRSHLVNRYFPHASHQVIILSTDTEIDQEFFSDLQPALSHAIKLTYDQHEVRTIIEDGYFWKKQNSNQKEAIGAT